MNCAIFGGSFDPPHIGHLEVIKKALNNLDIDILFCIPAFLNPFKQKTTFSPNKRLEWIRELTKNFANVEVLDFEVKNNRPTPSIETVLHIKDVFEPKKIYLIVGADNLANLSKWYKFSELEKLVTIVVASRDNIEISKKYKKLDIDLNVSSREIRGFQKIEFLPQTIRKEFLKFAGVN